MRTYCAFEDRPAALIGAKLLALSLERHCRDFTFYIGVAKELPEFAAWLKRHAPHAKLITLPPFNEVTIKQVKVLMFLHLFERGVTDVTWLDTDIMVLRDMEPLLAPLDAETVLVAQDMDYAFHYNPALMEHYHRKPQRKLDFCVTTALLRLTTRHTPLLQKLLVYLQDPFFLEQQALHYSKRIEGFGYEQKVFEMLLCTTDDDSSPSYPVHFIREGSGIVQELGVTTYGLRDRLCNGLGLTRPWIIHMPGLKSWDAAPRVRKYRSACVFSAIAASYAGQIEEPMDWVNSAGISSRLARLLSLGQPHWVGFWHCFGGKLLRFLRTGTTRRADTPDA
jgi:hypothetical protein